jgi:dipeptidyl aminopeptidase/acylaminoacyl peptidase
MFRRRYISGAAGVPTATESRSPRTATTPERSTCTCRVGTKPTRRSSTKATAAFSASKRGVSQVSSSRRQNASFDQNLSFFDPETGAAERWTDSGTLGIPRDTFSEPETVRYESFDGRAIPSYWTLPPDASPGETPVIVGIHGGPEHQRRPWFYPMKQYYLRRGYAAFEPNVRGSSGYGKAYTRLDDVEKRMDSVRDIAAAVGWLREQEAVDSDRIVAYGRSYGGFMVLAAITEYPELWAAAVDFVGIANFVTFLENTGDWRRSHREREYGSLTDDRALFEDISPIHDVDRISCPLFIQHGANDPRVPVGEAERIAEEVCQQGAPVETCIFEDEGHLTTSWENLIAQFERIVSFMDKHA